MPWDYLMQRTLAIRRARGLPAPPLRPRVPTPTPSNVYTLPPPAARRPAKQPMSIGKGIVIAVIIVVLAPLAYVALQLGAAAYLMQSYSKPPVKQNTVRK